MQVLQMQSLRRKVGLRAVLGQFEDWYPWKYLVDAEGQFADAKKAPSRR